MKGRSPLLDLMRGVAAVLVCAGHLRAAIMVDSGEVGALGPLNQLLYALTGLGHQAVMVFFVLSGYLVGGSVIASGRRFNWRRYAEARLSRLWTVLLPCLILTWAIDQVILATAPQVLSGVYAARWHSAPQTGQYDASGITFLGNVFFLQTIAVPVFGSNGPLWSLANEFWYYMLFPLLVWATAWREHAPPVRAKLMAAVLMLTIMACLPSDLLWGYAVWLMGVVVFLWHRQRAASSAQAHWPAAWARGMLAALALMAALGLSKWSAGRQWAWPWGDLLLGMGVAGFVACFAPWGASRWLQALAARLSDMSFSLYLSHFPIVMLIGTCRHLDARMQPGFLSWLIAAAWLGVLLLAGHLLWWLFERHTPAVRAAFGSPPVHEDDNLKRHHS